MDRQTDRQTDSNHIAVTGFLVFVGRELELKRSRWHRLVQTKPNICTV